MEEQENEIIDLQDNDIIENMDNLLEEIELFQINGGDKRRTDHMLPHRTIKKGGMAKTSSIINF